MTEHIRLDIPTRSSTLAYVKTPPRRNGKIEAKRTRMASENSGLNPAEILWSIFVKKMATKPMYSIMELRQQLEEEWNGISQLSCLNLIASMLDRIQKY